MDIFLIFIYCWGVVVSINKFSNAGIDWGNSQDTSLAIILSLFSWLIVLAMWAGSVTVVDREEEKKENDT
jgi:hypothetical protein